MNESYTTKSSRCEAINEIISSVAKEQDSLANILTAEAEKIKTVISSHVNTSDILDVNKSVDKMINSITKLEIILSGKLELFHDCLCEACDTKEQGYSIVSMYVENEHGGYIEKDSDLTFRYYPGTGASIINIVTDPDTLVTLNSELPVGLKFEGNKIIVPNGYNWTQSYNMKFLIGDVKETTYEITLTNIM